MNDSDCVSINVRYNPVQMDTFSLPGGMTLKGLIDHCLLVHEFTFIQGQSQDIMDRYRQTESYFNSLCHFVLDYEAVFYPDTLCGDTSERRVNKQTTLRTIVNQSLYVQTNQIIFHGPFGCLWANPNSQSILRERAPSSGSAVTASEPCAGATGSIKCKVILRQYYLPGDVGSTPKLQSQKELMVKEVSMTSKSFDVLPLDYQREVRDGYSPFGGSRMSQKIYTYDLEAGGATSIAMDWRNKKELCSKTLQELFDTVWETSPRDIVLFINVTTESAWS
jgi:hypothetical protein